MFIERDTTNENKGGQIHGKQAEFDFQGGALFLSGVRLTFTPSEEAGVTVSQCSIVRMGNIVGVSISFTKTTTKSVVGTINGISGLMSNNCWLNTNKQLYVAPNGQVVDYSSAIDTRTIQGFLFLDLA